MLAPIGKAESALRGLTHDFAVAAENLSVSLLEPKKPAEVSPTRPVEPVETRFPAQLHSTLPPDPVESTVKMLTTEKAIEANLRLIRSSEQSLGLLINTLA